MSLSFHSIRNYIIQTMLLHHNVFWSNLVFFFKSLTGRSNKIVIYLYKDNLDSLEMKILLALIII